MNALGSSRPLPCFKIKKEREMAIYQVPVVFTSPKCVHISIHTKINLANFQI
jgi:hypothetical protein